MTFRTRFAPSPTGPLHLGHAYSALLAYDLAVKNRGEFLLRIEDIDRARARPDWEAQIFDDLTWLGISWSNPVMRQSDRLTVYRQALDHLWDQQVLYVCTCTRRDIADAVSAPQEGTAPAIGPDGVIYPGTCRNAGHPRDAGAVRLDMQKALNQNPGPFSFQETGGMNDNTLIRFDKIEIMENIGDIVLARRDMGTSYHLSVVLDDAAQGITHVLRGHDLYEATKIHIVLQALLRLPSPIYHHHRLIRDETGKRLAKRDDARSIATYRANGDTPDDIRRRIGLPSGLALKLGAATK